MEKRVSYKRLIQAHVMSLGLKAEDVKRYYAQVHHVMAVAGIVDNESIGNGRKQPLKNSPWGEFKTKIGKGKGKTSVYSFLPSPKGSEEIKRILKTYITDNFLTDGKIASAEPLEEAVRQSVDVSVLMAWLKNREIDFRETKRDGVPVCVKFKIDGIRYACYHNNIHNRVEFMNRDGKPDNDGIFWVIYKNETRDKRSVQEKAKSAMDIFSAHWNLKFGNEVEQWKPIKVESKDSVPGSEQMEILMNQIEHLQKQIEELASGKVKKPVKQSKPKTKGLKTSMVNKMMTFSKPQRNQRRYKTINEESINKEKNPEKKELLQMAHDLLTERRLMTAVNRPKDGWKFDFIRKSIPLLYRVSDRESIVFNTRYRPLFPKDDIKEVAERGMEYHLPYGLENIDYSFKTIFIVEGIWDSCFLKNSLAQSCWTLPHRMWKVIDLFRDAGFQIVHVPDNFRIGDKGGIAFFQDIIQSKDWLQKGDRIFSWDVYGDCDDINKIAMTYALDEIPP